MNPSAMGRLKKIAYEPCDRASDCFRAISSWGARITARTTGASGKPNFRMR